MLRQVRLPLSAPPKLATRQLSQVAGTLRQRPYHHHLHLSALGQPLLLFLPSIKKACYTLTVTARSFSDRASDRLLGHSPMAPAAAIASSPLSSPFGIPTAADVTTAGGVWAPSSAKREKLSELKIELNSELGQISLDDVATPLQVLDLELADGLRTIAQIADVMPVDDELDEQQQQEQWLKLLAFPGDPKIAKDLTQSEYQDYLKTVSKRLEEQLATLPSDRCFRLLRDFDVQELPEVTTSTTSATATFSTTTDTAQVKDNDSTTTSDPTTTRLIQDQAASALDRYRYLLCAAAADYLATAPECWKWLTTVSDSDIDRAAVAGTTVEKQVSTVRLEPLQAVLHSFGRRTATDRVEAIWNLVDRDHDGRLEQSEMTVVCDLAIEPVRRALKRMFAEALEAHPVWLPLPPLEPTTSDSSSSSSSSTVTVVSSSSTPSNNYTSNPLTPVQHTHHPGWRQRRREAKHKKFLTTLFARTLRVHFLDEVEQPHRLRCIYAWANKAHQDNQIDSVLVDHDGGDTNPSSWSVRKRYVELPPKIALEEFREVQREHFPHLDRVGVEFCRAFREDLWVVQGKARQRRDLMRDCSLFLAVVCTMDYAIWLL